MMDVANTRYTLIRTILGDRKWTGRFPTEPRLGFLALADDIWSQTGVPLQQIY